MPITTNGSRPQPGPDEPVELRVHGIGGDAPQAVLGLPYPEDAVPVWKTAGGRQAVYARARDDRVRVFSWGELTSGSPWFALWTILLPFTLVNVAGWMVPRAAYGTGRARATGVLVYLGGLLLSAGAAVWLALAGTLLLPLGWGLFAGAVVLAAVIGTAMSVAARFEAYPEGAEGAPTRAIWSAAPPLHDAAFFENVRIHRRRSCFHAIALVLVTVATAAVALLGDDADAPRELAWAALTLTVAELVVLVLLAFVSFTPAAGAGRWRWSGPAVAAGLGVVLLNGVATAGLHRVADDTDRANAGPAFALLDVYGAAAVASGVVLVLVLALVLLRPSPAEQLEPGRLQHERLLGPVSRRRARLAQLPRHVDLPLTTLVLAFVVGAAVVLVVRRDELDGWEASDNWLRRASLAVVGALLAKLVLDILKNARSRDARRRIGQVWDILTFWPRIWHPLAVRPYAERAVPELRAYLARGKNRWVLTAHSQGSVLAYAAVCAADEDVQRRVDLLTFGSPLATLYAKAFPTWFDVDGFRGVRHSLQHRGGSWSNVFRATDHVGRGVFTPDGERPDGGADIGLADPNRMPPVHDPDVPDLEQDLPLDDAVWGHSGYRRSHLLKALVRARRLAGQA